MPVVFPLIRRQLANHPRNGGDATLAAKLCYANFLKRRFVSGRSNFGEDFLLFLWIKIK